MSKTWASTRMQVTQVHLTIYQAAEAEKVTRGRIKFEVEKNLVGNTVVIVDSLNFIKGYRYQMYCIAR